VASKSNDGSSHFAHVNVECPDDGCPKLQIYISAFILDMYEYIPVVYVVMYCIFLP